MNQHYKNFKAMVEGETRTDGPTLMQIGELKKLVVEREFPSGHPMGDAAQPAMRVRAIDERLRSLNPSHTQVEGWLKWMRDLPLPSPQQELFVKPERATEEPAPGPVTEDGMYMLNGDIYKVQVAVHGSGRLYAKKLFPPAYKGRKATFEYAPGVIRMLTSADKLTKEKAQEFGALYGTCCRCGRTLTAEDSIERMMGPVCFGKMGW